MINLVMTETEEAFHLRGDSGESFVSGKSNDGMKAWFTRLKFETCTSL